MEQSNAISYPESLHNSIDVKYNTKDGGIASTNIDAYETIALQHSKTKSSFLESMTFTTVTAKCDCDECCNDVGSKRRNTQIPQSISAAIQSHKRAKLSEVLVMRSQVRTLIARSEVLKNLAIWELTMPSLAEPLVEFGNPSIYRIIWIKRLHKRLLIKKIGRGIIGSKNEEEGREQLEWIENDVIFVSSMDQKAVGYIAEAVPSNDDTGDLDDEFSCSSLPGPVVLYIAKVPAELLLRVHQVGDFSADDVAVPFNDDNGLVSGAICALDVVRRICSRAVHANDGNELKGNGVPLDKNDQSLFRKAVIAMTKR